MTVATSMQPQVEGGAPPPSDRQPAAAVVPTPGVPACPGRLSEVYDVQKPVGKGGYAVVYKAVRRLDGRVVAVKRVEVFDMSQKKRERCLQEVTLLAQLNHPYIIQMLDAFIDENMLIIIFEWAPAGDLKRLLKKTADAGKTLDEPVIWNYFSQIVDGLRCMHAHRIMHRDIKPANVLVGANGSLKLGDLGLGRQLSHQTMEAFSKVGTPYYVSPEVVRGAGYDWKSDVWSLGCLLYELACLKSPFEMEGANLYDVFQRISKADFEPLPQAQFSPTLTDLVARMLSVDPAARPDLQEVWRISQNSLDVQGASGMDLYVAAETVHAQLMLLESVINAAAAKEPDRRATASALRKDSKPANGESCGKGSVNHANSSVDSAAAYVNQAGCSDSSNRAGAPPSHVLRTLHPAYFAEAQGGNKALTCLGALRSEHLQKQQLGIFLQVFAWLLHVAGWPDMAASVQQWVQVQAVPSPPSDRIEQQAVKQRHARSSRQPDTAICGNLLQRTSSIGLSPAPPGMRSGAGIAVCTNMIKGSEAVKHAAQAAGLPTDYVPLSAIAAGHGRAVCSLLQNLLDIALRKVPLVLARPSHRPESDLPDEAAQDEDDVCSSDDGRALITVDSPMPNVHRQCGESSDTLLESWGHPPSSIAQDQHAQQRGGISQPGHDRIQHGCSTSPATSRPWPRAQVKAGGIAATAIHGQVDAVAWHQEAERLAPQLSRIKISAAALGGLAPSDWWPRWERLRQGAGVLQQQAGSTIAMMQHVREAVKAQLEQIHQQEHRIAGDALVSQLLQQFAGLRQQQQLLQKDIMAAEELQHLGHAALLQLGTRLQEVQLHLEAKAQGLDGCASLKQVLDAISALKQEMQSADVRIGTMQAALLARQH